MDLSSFTVNATIHGHHVYKEIWTPVIGEQLACAIEDSNDWDPYAVAINQGWNLEQTLVTFSAVSQQLAICFWNRVIQFYVQLVTLEYI